jgi:hypothetical protein
MVKHERAMVSQELKAAVLARRAAGEPQHQIARRADLHPSVFSTLVNDVIPVRMGDERVIRIGAACGIPPERCFAPTGKR